MGTFAQPARSQLKFPGIEPLLHAGRYGEAIVASEALVAAEPDNSGAWRMLHLAHKGARDFEPALAAIDRALALKPDNLVYAKLRAICLKECGRDRDAIAALERLYDPAQPDPDLCGALKVSYYRLGALLRAQAYGALRLDRLANGDGAIENGATPPAGAPVAAGASVAAFSLWGHEARYCVGAVANARAVRDLMPGWIARFYVADDVPADVVEALRRHGGEIVRATAVPDFVPNYMWRFLVADDASVGRFICRDTDGRITPKEIAAVQAWIASPRRYHILRDHIFHDEPMLAGLWGGVRDTGWSMTDLIRAHQTAHQADRRYGVDQHFLATAVWPLIRHDALTHDSYYTLGDTHPFPIGGRGDDADHVGMGHAGADALRREAAALGLG